MCDMRAQQQVTDEYVEDSMRQLLDELFLLFRNRNRKYGPLTPARAGIKGIISRVVYDKCGRLERWLLGVSDTFDDESLIDTLADVALYCLIGILVYRGRWPKIDLTCDTHVGNILIRK